MRYGSRLISVRLGPDTGAARRRPWTFAYYSSSRRRSSHSSTTTTATGQHCLRFVAGRRATRFGVSLLRKAIVSCLYDCIDIRCYGVTLPRIRVIDVKIQTLIDPAISTRVLHRPTDRPTDRPSDLPVKHRSHRCTCTGFPLRAAPSSA